MIRPLCTPSQKKLFLAVILQSSTRLDACLGDTSCSLRTVHWTLLFLISDERNPMNLIGLIAETGNGAHSNGGTMFKVEILTETSKYAISQV